MKFIKKITTAGENRTTYRVGLLQAKAYRILRQHTDKKLIPFDMSSTHWALLGLLYEAKAGLRPGEVANELGVEAPFVTRMVNEFKKKKLVEQKEDPSDSRANVLFLTAAGKAEVKKIESVLRVEMAPLIKDVAFGDLLSYLLVLKKIIENAEEKK
jgi:MarR family transcriptional regulator for hemolysin